MKEGYAMSEIKITKERIDALLSCVPWLASQTDMLAEDWEIAEVRHG